MHGARRSTLALAVGSTFVVLLLLGRAADARLRADAPRVMQAGEPAASPAQDGMWWVYLPLVLTGATRDDLPDAPTLEPPTAIPTASNTPFIFPTDTPTPTRTATMTPIPPTETPTPTPTPTPTVALDCTQILPNGDFEEGAALWELTVNGQPKPLSQSIKRGEAAGIRPKGGENVAVLGGYVDAVIELRSNRVQGIDTDRVTSVVLHYWVAIATQERRDGRADDSLEVWVEADDREYPVEGARHSEETLITQGLWYEVSADVTDLFKRGGRKEFILRSRQDGDSGSIFFVDEVTVNACMPPP